MNLQHITSDLERTLRRHLRRTDTVQTWAEEHPALSLSIDKLLHQMRDTDRTTSHPVLAALVDLARNGDQHAAQLVTVGLLQKFADKEKTRGGTWDQFPGHLYEAIVTCHSTDSRCLREIIERNALRRNLKTRTLGSREVSLDWVEGLPSDELGPESTALRIVARAEVVNMIGRLVQEHRVNDSTRRVLHHIASGSDRATVPEFDGRSPNTIRTRCRRAAHILRSDRLRTELLQAIA